ncbi:MAG TPA: hypothetical protein VER11_02025 [Polyangiaceae bacterium]|nr:hypothetical protein [Polyangiaceae bacterium]
MSTLRLLALALSSTLLACGGPTSKGSGTEASGGASALAPVSAPELTLQRVGEGQVTVTLRAPDERRPRMVDARVRWSKGWSLDSQQAGNAANASDKTLYVKPVSETEARVIVFSSSNTQRLPDGVLAQLKFSGSGKGTVEIVPVPPMLAPADTEQGLHIGDPISL